jgi:hypothetical protein
MVATSASCAVSLGHFPHMAVKDRDQEKAYTIERALCVWYGQVTVNSPCIAGIGEPIAHSSLTSAICRSSQTQRLDLR